MSRVEQPYVGGAKIRNRAISSKLETLFDTVAGELGVNVEVWSGGQTSDRDPKLRGAHGGYTGSHRHDEGGAADIRLFVTEGGKKRYLDWSNDADQKVWSDFVRLSKAGGATGIGAGKDYMGTDKVHIGYGPPAVWGTVKKGGPAPPDWLTGAVSAGKTTPPLPIPPTAPSPMPGRPFGNTAAPAVPLPRARPPTPPPAGSFTLPPPAVPLNPPMPPRPAAGVEYPTGYAPQWQTLQDMLAKGDAADIEKRVPPAIPSKPLPISIQATDGRAPRRTSDLLPPPQENVMDDVAHLYTLQKRIPPSLKDVVWKDGVVSRPGVAPTPMSGRPAGMSASIPPMPMSRPPLPSPTPPVPMPAPGFRSPVVAPGSPPPIPAGLPAFRRPVEAATPAPGAPPAIPSGGFDLGAMFAGLGETIGAKAQEAGAALGNATTSTFEGAKNAVATTAGNATDLLKNELMGTVGGRTLLLNTLMGNKGTIYTSPGKYGATPEARREAAARRQALQEGRPYIAPGQQTAVRSSLSVRPPSFKPPQSRAERFTNLDAFGMIL